MKKKIFVVAVAVILLFSAMSVTGCAIDPPESVHTHTLKEVSATEPTCVSEGNVKYYECEECGAIFLDEQCTLPASKSDVIINKKTHTLKEVSATEPTCVSEGNVKYYECDECGEIFLDEQGTIVANDENIVLGKKSHEYELSSVNEVSHTMKCSYCNAALIEPHVPKDPSGRNVGHVYKTVCECGYVCSYENIPTISVMTNNGQEIQGNRTSAEYYDCTVSVSDCDEEYEMTDVTARVKVRGNYSADYPKKPYKIKFDSKRVMLGVNEELKAKEWVLLADYKDRSLLRNPTVHYLADEMLGENGYYCTDSRYVRVYVNGRYRGLYLLVEQQEVREERVNVPEPADPEDFAQGSAEYEAAMNDIYTGYLVELDAYANEEIALERFSITYKNGGKYANGSNVGTNKFQSMYAIKSKVYSEAQNNFIKNTVQNIYEAVSDAVYNQHNDLNVYPYKQIDKDGKLVDVPTIKTEKEAVEGLINLDSLVDTFILNEICMDMDIGWSSFLMSIDMSENGDRKLTFQAPWDWDSALGFDVDETDDGMFSCMPYYGNSGSGTPKTWVNPWLTLLSSRQWFRDAVAERYIQLRERGVFEESIKRLDLFSTLYANEIAENFSQWPKCLTSGLGGNGYYNGCTTHEAAKEYLKDFLEKRYAALDKLLTVGNTWTN